MNIRQVNSVKGKLEEFVQIFAENLGRKERQHWCHIYLCGLLLNIERKSIEPIAKAVNGGNVQALQQFVNQSPWDYESILSTLRFTVREKLKTENEVWNLDDTSLPKKGKNSVGVAHQYCGALGKLSNCQSLVTWHAVTKNFHYPLGVELYLPEEWTNDKERMDKAGIPKDKQVFKEKWKIALDELDKLLLEKRPEIVVFDSAYGSNRKFLGELDKRSIYFVGQIREIETFWNGEIPLSKVEDWHQGNGRPRKHTLCNDGRFRPKSAKDWARFLFSNEKNVIKVRSDQAYVKTRKFAAMKVYEAVARPFHRVGMERWLLVEELQDGGHKYYVSNCPPQMSVKKIFKYGKLRWTIEQGYQQLKEELGLDHFEGRSWLGLHHHVVLTFMAYDFLQILRYQKKNGRNPNFA